MNSNYFVNELLHNLIVSDEDRLFRSNFNKFRYFYWLLNDLLYLVYLRHLMYYLDNLFMDSRDLFDPFLDLCSKDWLFFDYLYTCHFFSNIRYYFLDLFNFLWCHYFLFYPRELFNSCNLFYNLNKFLDSNFYLNWLFYFFFNHN